MFVYIKHFKPAVNNVRQVIKACIIDVQITWVSNYRYPIIIVSKMFKLDVLVHPCSHALITQEIAC